MRTDAEQLSNPEQFCFTSEPCLKVLEPTVTDSPQSFPSFTEQFKMKTSNLEENSGTKTLNRQDTQKYFRIQQKQKNFTFYIYFFSDNEKETKYITMVSCDTEDKFSFVITEINNIMKYIQIENSYFKWHNSK